MTDAKIYGPELVYKSFKRTAGIELDFTVLLKQLPWQQAKAVILEKEWAVPIQRKIITAGPLAKPNHLTRLSIHQRKTTRRLRLIGTASKDSLPRQAV